MSIRKRTPTTVSDICRLRQQIIPARFAKHTAETVVISTIFRLGARINKRPCQNLACSQINISVIQPERNRVHPVRYIPVSGGQWVSLPLLVPATGKPSRPSWQ